MSAYFRKRLLLVIPTLVLVSFLAFWLQESAPGDPVAQYLRDADPEAAMPLRDLRVHEAAYHRAAHELGMDRPAFYVGITPRSLPDTLHRILPLAKRATFSSWCRQTGSPIQVQIWYDQLDQYQKAILQLDPSGKDPKMATVRTDLARIPFLTDPIQVRSLMENLPDSLAADERQSALSAIPVFQNGFIASNWLPRISWNGFNNRYHRWMVSLFGGSSHRSWVDGQPVWRKISQAAKWTLLMNGFAILFAYGLSIPLGVWMARHAGTARDQWTTFLLYAMYSVPGFWLGTLLLVFFTTPVYGMDLFPSIGLGDIPHHASGLEILIIRTSHLFLPIFCLTYGSLAYLTRQVRNAMLKELKQDYIRAAWAKGLSARHVIWRHAFRNALFPLITLFGAVLPAAIAGSVAIEVIFNIPGMGRLTYASILSQDWPVVYGVLFLAAILTLAGSLISDLLYGWADPRVRWQR